MVQQYLPLAANRCDEDPEAVHLLRVSTRRATAALNLYAGLLPRRSKARVTRNLRRIRRAAGTVRDLDVMIQRLEKKHRNVKKERLLEHLRHNRACAQHRLARVYKRLGRGGSLGRRTGKLLHRVKCRRNAAMNPEQWQFGAWARMQLRPMAAKFFEALPPPEASIADLHQLRIRGKKLRYVMELLAGAFSASFRDRLYPIAETLQQKLGTINDHATALLLLRQRLEAVEDSGEAGHLRTLLDRESAELEQARHGFLEWWTPSRQEELRTGFEEELQGRHAPNFA